MNISKLKVVLKYIFGGIDSVMEYLLEIVNAALAKIDTDGASVPRFLWRLCGHPLKAPRVYAALLHDWLYEGADPDGWTDGARPSEVSREDADECYRALSRHFGIPWWKANIEYYALRWFGKAHYKE